MGGESKVFTLAEVSKHNNSKDCWLVIDGKVSRLLARDGSSVSFEYCVVVIFPLIFFSFWVCCVGRFSKF